MINKEAQGKEQKRQADKHCHEKRGKEDSCRICGTAAQISINGKDYCIKCFPDNR